MAAVGSLWGLEKQRQWWPPLPTVFYSMGPIPSIIIIHHHMRPLYCLKKIENFPRPLFINYSFIISYKSKFPHTRHLIGCNLLKSCLGPTWKAKSVKFLCKKQEPLTLWMYSVYSLPLTFRKKPKLFPNSPLGQPMQGPSLQTWTLVVFVGPLMQIHWRTFFSSEPTSFSVRSTYTYQKKKSTYDFNYPFFTWEELFWLLRSTNLYMPTANSCRYFMIPDMGQKEKLGFSLGHFHLLSD